MEKSGQDKDSVKSASSLPEAELLITKEMVILSGGGHLGAHPDGYKAQQVGGDCDGAVLTGLERITTL